MRVRLTVTDVQYGHETPEELTSDILQILFHHLKLDPHRSYTTQVSKKEKSNQTMTYRKHRRE